MSCPSCMEMAAAMERQADAIGDLEREVRRLLARERNLLRELNDRRKTHPRKAEAREVYEFWKEACHPSARTMEGKRAAAILARLDEGHTVDELKEAILGAKADPTISRKGVKYDDIELICRDATNVDSFRKRYRAWKERQELAKDARPAGQEVPRAPSKAWAKPEKRRRLVDPDPVLRILDRLTLHGCTWRPSFGHERWMAQCPAHADRSPSLSISQVPDEDGNPKVLLNCFAGCTVDEIVGALDLSLTDLFSTQWEAA